MVLRPRKFGAMKTGGIKLGMLVLLFAADLVFGIQEALAQERLYKGKTLNIIIGLEPGGTGDMDGLSA